MSCRSTGFSGIDALLSKETNNAVLDLKQGTVNQAGDNDLNAN